MTDNGFKELSLKIEALDSRAKASEKLFNNRFDALETSFNGQFQGIRDKVDALDTSFNGQMEGMRDKLDAFLVYAKSMEKEYARTQELYEHILKLHNQIMRRLDKLDDIEQSIGFRLKEKESEYSAKKQKY